MGSTLKERAGITTEQINTLAMVADTTGVCITEHNSLDAFMASFLATRETATLEDIANGLVGGLDEKVRKQAANELINRQ